MKKTRLTAQARRHLDERFTAIGPIAHFTPPVRGWIQAIRGALGMTTAQLAKRMRIKQPSIIALERSEAKGSIELATLRRAAEALDCTLIYALVPNTHSHQPLDAMVRERVSAFMRQRLEPVEHSMLLEDQKVIGKDADVRIDEIMRETNPRLFWD